MSLIHGRRKENAAESQSAATTYGRAFTSRTIGGRELIALQLKVRRYRSLVCSTPAKTANRFCKLTLDYPQRN
jgi:hypothetical protein